MAKRRRTSGIQRRDRASDEALNRRLDAQRGIGLPDWRLLAIGGVLVVGVILIVLVVAFGGVPNPYAGVTYPNDGGQHVEVGTTCRSPQAPCGPDPYSSTPGTSGPHWDPTGIANWGVYSTPQNETQLIHNLEHGGIVIWYDPERVDQAGIDEMAAYVEGQVAQGQGGRFKFILSPWDGIDPLPSAVVVTAWRHALELDEVDMDAIRGFADVSYLRYAPEPNGGPAP
jgi:hypothetical protein